LQSDSDFLIADPSWEVGMHPKRQSETYISLGKGRVRRGSTSSGSDVNILDYFCTIIRDRFFQW